MFDSGMKESRNGLVDIDDIDADTLQGSTDNDNGSRVDLQLLSGCEMAPFCSMIVLMLINMTVDNANVNVVNKDNPGQFLRNQVVDNMNENVVNKDNPGQVLRNQVVNVVNVMKDNVGVLAVLAMHSGNTNKIIELRSAREVKDNVGMLMEVTMDNENNPEQVPTSQVVGVINVNEVYGDMDATLNEEDGNVVNVVCMVTMNEVYRVSHSPLFVKFQFRKYLIRLPII
jgi:hypothetical protein